MSPEEQHVRAVLEEGFGEGCIDASSGIDNLTGEYVCWSPEFDGTLATLDGSFTAIQLAAIAWWMMHKEKRDGDSNTPAGGTDQA